MNMCVSDGYSMITCWLFNSRFGAITISVILILLAIYLYLRLNKWLKQKEKDMSVDYPIVDVIFGTIIMLLGISIIFFTVDITTKNYQDNTYYQTRNLYGFIFNQGQTNEERTDIVHDYIKKEYKDENPNISLETYTLVYDDINKVKSDVLHIQNARSIDTHLQQHPITDVSLKLNNDKSKFERELLDDSVPTKIRCDIDTHNTDTVTMTGYLVKENLPNRIYKGFYNAELTLPQNHKVCVKLKESDEQTFK